MINPLLLRTPEITETMPCPWQSKAAHSTQHTGSLFIAFYCFALYPVAPWNPADILEMPASPAAHSDALPADPELPLGYASLSSPLSD